MSSPVRNPDAPAIIVQSPSVENTTAPSTSHQPSSIQNDALERLDKENFKLRNEISEFKEDFRELEGKLFHAQEAQIEQAANFTRDLEVLRDEVAAKADEAKNHSNTAAAVSLMNEVNEATIQGLQKRIKSLLDEKHRYQASQAGRQGEQSSRTAAQRIRDAEDLQRAAELEAQGLRALSTLEGGLFAQNAELHKQLASALQDATDDAAAFRRELAAKDDIIHSLQEKVKRAHGHIAEIESKLRIARADLATYQSDLATSQANLTATQAALTTAQSDLATAQAKAIPPPSSSESESNRFAGQVFITIKPVGSKPFAMLRYVKQAVSKTSSITIDGPPGTADALMAEMTRLELSHEECLEKAKRWQRTATQAMDHTNAAQDRCERINQRAEQLAKENDLLRSRVNGI